MAISHAKDLSIPCIPYLSIKTKPCEDGIFICSDGSFLPIPSKSPKQSIQIWNFLSGDTKLLTQNIYTQRRGNTA